MDVIGVGFGRTGTMSLQAALEQLGLGPCYHWKTVLTEPERTPAWQRAANGEAADWKTLFEGFRSTVDWPGTAFWRELVDACPAAKVVLTVRDPDTWYRSMDATILSVLRSAAEAVPGQVSPETALAQALVGERTFHGRFLDRDHVIETFRRHTAEVSAYVPAERLLVFEVGSGWGPLCEFLDLPVPDSDFPRLNDQAQFQQRRRDASAAALAED